MIRLGRIALGAVVFLIAVVGTLYIGARENKSAEDGPADPVIETRRDVLGLLRSMGLVDEPGFFGGGYLPSIGSSEIGAEIEKASDEFITVYRMEIEREPVYRGLLWLVGERITYRAAHFDEEQHDARALRLCYAENGKTFVVGERPREPGKPTGAGKFWEVKGYVPRTADGYWVEEVDESGAGRLKHSWGHGSWACPADE